jgi:hypothetical protein
VKAVKPELTPEAMLADMGLHARSSVVHVEPSTVAEWRECIGHVLCGAAFDAGLAQAAQAAEREACALLVGDYVELASGNRVRTDFARAIRARWPR